MVDASISGEDKALVSGDGNRPTALHQARALITKRVVLFSRNWFTTAIVWIVPMLVFALLFHAERQLLQMEKAPRPVAVSLPGLYPSAAAFVQEDSISRDLASTYREVARDQGATVEVLEDAETHLLELGEKDFAAYVQKFVAGAVFAVDRNETGKVRAEGWYSSHADASPLVALNLLTTAVLRNVTGDTTARINVTLVSAGVLQGTIRQLKELGNIVILKIMSILLYLVVGLLVSVFALQPVVERASRSKDVQLVTGISGFLYWSSHFLFDVVIYTTCWVLASVIFFQQHSIRADSIGAVVALVLSFPLVALPTAYLTSFVVKSQSLAATIVVVAFSATGTSEAWRQIRFFKDCIHEACHREAPFDQATRRVQRELQTASRITEVQWLQILATLPKKRECRSPEAQAVHVIGNTDVPDKAQRVLCLGPKFCNQPELSKPELLSMVRSTAARADAENVEGVIRDGVDCLRRSSKGTSSIGTEDTISALREANLKLLLSDKEGGFAIVPDDIYNQKAAEAITSNFTLLKSYKPEKTKKEAVKMCERLNLTKLASSVRNCKGLSMEAFFSAKTHKMACPFRVIVSERGTWQRLLGYYLQKSLFVLEVEDPYLVRTPSMVSDYLQQLPKGKVLAFSVDIKDYTIPFLTTLFVKQSTTALIDMDL
ncbi:hypothetical protein ISCGN_018641 [Ixodes scapularis]